MRYTAAASIFVFASLLSSNQADEALSLSVTASADTSSTYPKILVSWMTSLTFTSVTVSWQHCTYSDQVTCRELGRQTVFPKEAASLPKEAASLPKEAASLPKEAASLQLTESVKFDGQFLITVRGVDACGHVTSGSSYVTVHRPSKDRPTSPGPLYLVLGPVTSTNLTVQFERLPGGPSMPGPQNPPSFRVSWRRVDGTVGHPGHETTLVTYRHLIQGLLPATRYEVCVRDLTEATPLVPCEEVYTREAVPGPPSPGDAWCGTEVRGTHWRCDVTWNSPIRTNGKIIRYAVQWRDSEGYSLYTVHPSGTLCSPECRSTAVLPFHPHEACVSAATRVGDGWEECIPVHDTRSRMLAVFERRLLWAVAATLLVALLGPRLLGALCRCCIRGLARHVDDTKSHQV